MEDFRCPECQRPLREAPKALCYKCDWCQNYFCIVRIPDGLMRAAAGETTAEIFDAASLRFDEHYAALMQQIDEVQP